jgi:hypothetical protein
MNVNCNSAHIGLQAPVLSEFIFLDEQSLTLFFYFEFWTVYFWWNSYKNFKYERLLFAENKM